MIDVDLGTAIRRKRIEVGMSSARLAECAGVSRQSLHRWETGQSVPRQQYAERLKLVLKMKGMQVNDRAVGPCEVFSCKSQKICRANKLACLDFEKFVDTGICREPNRPEPTHHIFMRIFAQSEDG